MKQRILAVDDEPDMLRLLERIITEKTPYSIEICGNALEVPAILEDRTFDVIITDLKMPGMDGLDILRMVQEKDRKEEVIIITAFGSLDSAVEALSKGIYDYITKPFKKEQIISTVGKAMQWQKTRKEMSRMTGIFDREPYEEAVDAFQLEYVKQLALRHGGNEKAMAERSGLPADLIRSVLVDD
ncbi:response regulator [Thermodesulfobacteriota bacterium]